MTLSFHENAKDNFDKTAETFIGKVKAAPKEAPKQSPSVVMPENIPVLTDKDFDLDSIQFTNADMYGNPISQYFNTPNGFMGLDANDYQLLVKLSRQMYRVVKGIDAVQERDLQTLVFEWVEVRFKNKSSSSLSDFLEEKITAKIEKIEVWLPVAGLRLGGELVVGRVKFVPMTSALFDVWFSKHLDLGPEKTERKKMWFDKMKQELVGKVCAIYSGIGERNRVVELAKEEIEKSLSVLRIFFVSSFNPLFTSLLTLLGNETLRTFKALYVKDGILQGSNSSSLDRNAKTWNLSNAEFDSAKRVGLQRLSDFLEKGIGSEFQKDFLDSFTLYSKSFLHSDFVERLIYILVSLESFLLKDSSESIQQNVSERIALSLNVTVEERKHIVKNFKRIYDLRSSFLHHGKVKYEESEVIYFLKVVFSYWISVSVNLDTFKTKNEYFEYLDTVKLSLPTIRTDR